MESNYCTKCGSKISKNTKFCGNCGEEINEPKTKDNSCPKCGYVFKVNEKYCHECGTAITLASKAKKSQTVAEKTTMPPVKKKKAGILRNIGKVTLWIFGIFLLSIAALYFIGDNSNDSYVGDKQQKESLESNIPEEEMKLPPLQVRQANSKLKETLLFQVLSQNKSQEFSFGENIKVILPPNFTSKEQSLAISKATVDESIMVADRKALALVDLTLDNGKQPSKPVQLSYTFNETELNPTLTTEEQLDAYRWDEESGGWVSLPVYIDQKNSMVSAYVDHFSLIGFFSTVVDEVVKANDKINEKFNELEERIWNDMYITPEGNFRIYYSKSFVENSVHFNNKTWKRNYTRSNYPYNNAYPNYIQDIGYFLEASLQKYVEAGFANPASDKKMFNNTYKKPITVKIDSYWSKASNFENPLSNSSQGVPSYEKIHERLHIPSFETSDYKRAEIVLAHELFHRIQAQYYGILGLARPGNNWFIEATAEYAAYEIAWPTQKDKMSDNTGSDYLRHSINSTGNKRGLGGKGWIDERYEYKTSTWIKYLVASGINFKDLIEYDAADYYKPLYSQQKFLWNSLNKSMGNLYRNFSLYMLFSKKSPLRNFDFSLDLATNYKDWDMEKTKEISQEFNMANKYSAQMGVVKVNTKKQQGKLVLITLEEQDVIGQTVDLIIVNKTSKKANSVGTLFKEEDKKLITVNNGDHISLVVCNSDNGGGITKMSIKDASPQLTVTPSEMLDAVGNKAYSFEISAEDIIDAIEKVDIEWDFNDNTKKSKGFQKSIIPTSGEAKIKIAHTYEESDKEQTYPLKVTLRESSTKKVLATAEAKILLPLPKPEVFITTRHLTGPPGATFDVTAKASPNDTYKFKWYIEGMSNSYTYKGKESTFKPVAKKLGKYNVNVKLFNLNDEFLSEDNATIYVEEPTKNSNIERIYFVVKYQGKFKTINQKKANPEVEKTMEALSKAYGFDENKTPEYNNLEINGYNQNQKETFNGRQVIGEVYQVSNEIVSTFQSKMINSEEKEQQSLNVTMKNDNTFNFTFNKSDNYSEQFFTQSLILQNIPLESDVRNNEKFKEFRFEGNISNYLKEFNYKRGYLDSNESTFIEKINSNDWSIYFAIAYKK